MQCFRTTVNRVRTRFPKDRSNEPETVSRVVFVLLLDLLTRQMLGNHFLMETKIICLIKQGLNLRSRNIKRDLLTVVSMSSSNKLMIKDWNWRTPITDLLKLEENNFANKKIIYEGKIASRNSDTKCTRDWRNEKSARITNRRILSTKLERKS